MLFDFLRDYATILIFLFISIGLGFAFILANFLFSVLIFSLIFVIQGIPVEEPVVGKVNSYYEDNYDLKVNDQILKVEDKVLDKRRSNWTNPIKTPKKGVLAKYAKSVKSASLGATTD